MAAAAVPASRAASSLPAYSGTKVVAIGKNYAKHKVEMGGTPDRPSVPMFFFKPNSAVVHPPAPIVRPSFCEDMHHEVELGIVIGKKCRNVPEADWRSVVGGWTLALDMTARDTQAAAKAKGHPWALAKGFDTSCAMSPVLPVDAVPDPAAVELWCSVDNDERQRGSTGDMLFSVPELIAYVTSVLTLEEGDVILTGTPHGVGAVAPGETIRAGMLVAGEAVPGASIEFAVEAEGR